MENTEVRQLTDKELEERIENEKSQLNRMKINHAVSDLDNPLKIRFARKNIARLKTELQRRKNQEAVKTEK